MYALLETVQRVFSLQSVPWLYIWDSKEACRFRWEYKITTVRNKPLFGEHVLIIYSVIREMPYFKKILEIFNIMKHYGGANILMGNMCY
jgi:hypothetical protein